MDKMANGEMPGVVERRVSQDDESGVRMMMMPVLCR